MAAERAGPSSSRGGFGSAVASHPWEQAALDLVAFMQDTPPRLADQIKVGGRAPWQGRLSAADQLRYYALVLAGLGPPTEPNEQALAQRIGEPGVLAVKQELAKAQRQQQAPEGSAPA